MTELEQSYYVVAIVFMGIMLVLITALVVAIIVIRNKVVALENTVSEKLHAAIKLPEKIVEIATAVKDLKDAIK